MIDLTRRSQMGDTAAEYLQDIALDVDGDGEGLWSIVPAGRSFGFDDVEPAEYVRLCVLRFLEAGAIPVRHSPQGEPMRWKEQTQYGARHDEIASAIVAEWLEAGGGDPPWGYLWFVTREVLETDRRE